VDQKLSIDAALSEARTYIGCKWRHRGRSRFGIDCIGLVVKFAEAGGIKMRDRIDYGREPWRDGLEHEMREHFGSPVENMQKGDIVLMAWDGQAEPSHVGIIGEHDGRLTLIHSYSLVAVTEHGIDDVWKKRIVRIFRPWHK
jgi:cell wall-associated NlpC family hydrolase